MPPPVARPWENLLTQRALLHAALRQFDGVDDYGRRLASPSLDDRKDCAALESFAERCFHIVLELGIELLIAGAPDERATIKQLPAEAILGALRSRNVLTRVLWEMLDEVRQGRNELVHGPSFVPWRQAWAHIQAIEGSIDKVMVALQTNFSRLGIQLEMAWPEFHDRGGD